MMLEQTSNSRARYHWFAGNVEAPPTSLATALANGVVTAHAIFRAVFGATTVAAIVWFEIWNPPILAVATLVGAAWLCLGSVVHVAALHLIRMASPLRKSSGIPLRFAGSTGRFVLRQRARTHVEVRAGTELVAELVAHGVGDELVVYDVASISSEELPALGSAIGQAMLMTAATARAPAASSHHTPFE